MITSDLILSLLEILAAAWILGFIFSRFGLSITAIAVQAVVLQAMKINRTALGHIIIGAAIADDILALIALSTLLGLAKTGGIVSNGSGDYVIAVSTNENLRIPYEGTTNFKEGRVLRNNAMSPLFLAVNEATEEAILNSLFKATSVTGRDKHIMEALPIEKVLKIISLYKKTQ